MKITAEMYAAGGVCMLALVLAVPEFLRTSELYDTPVKKLTVELIKQVAVVLVTTVTGPLEAKYTQALKTDPFSKPQAVRSVVDDVRLPPLPRPQLRLPDLPIMPLGNREGER